MPDSSWQKAERVLRIGANSGWSERQSESSAVIVIAPLITIVGTVRVAAFAEGDRFCRAVDVAPVHREALRWAEGFTDLLHSEGIAAQRLLARSGHAADERQK